VPKPQKSVVSESLRFLAQFRQTLITLQETFWIALDTLRSHKLRTFLTLLGVMLAVTTLIAVMSVLNGLNLYVANKIANLGSNAFVIDRVGIATNLEQWNKGRKRPQLRLDDLEALRDGMKLAEHVAGMQQTTADVRYGNSLSEDVSIIGATPEYAEIRTMDAAQGRLLSTIEEEHRSSVCVIGPDLAAKLFAGIDPIGREIHAGQGEYEIVGVAAPKGSVLGQSQDNFVMIPLGTYRKQWLAPQDSVEIFVEARSRQAMSSAVDEARVILRSRRHVAYQDDDNFGIVEPSALMGIWDQLTANIFGVAVWVTSVFLVVGGIVIMNIMLASVTERTREIGLRKSLGARRRHIVMQFLVESSLLATSGGLVGVAIALGIAGLVRASTPIPISTPVFAVIVALVLSTSVGLFFGIYPAIRAARLDPIEALRADA
jgi:putative ABC transport system permease protein